MRPSSLVSVIVATRNRPDLLRECLDGIAAQDHQAVEVLVVDDGSSQATRDAYAALCPALAGRVRWLLPEHPDGPGTGPAAARNRGLRAATGTFVAFCDDDDRWIRTDHLQASVRALEKASADFFFSDLTAGDRPIAPDPAPLYGLQKLARDGLRVEELDVFAVDRSAVLRFMGGRLIHPDCWVVRTSLFNEVGGFWERLWWSEDYNLMLRLLDRARKVVFSPVLSGYYRSPVADSHSLQTAPLEAILQEVLAAQHARFLARTPAVRRHARSVEAWGFRALARRLRSDGHRQGARAFAWQGLCTYPTLGALRDWLRR